MNNGVKGVCALWGFVTLIGLLAYIFGPTIILFATGFIVMLVFSFVMHTTLEDHI